ncbi:hypothetical protein AAF712_012585 [Marasmius tenuissimus]|uniref:4-coumarate--CoA ligase n=1 Tax=Marasmius tenuissimus TaxID=585030 RepID=A0ABR2ZJL3_9AGAR
MYFSSPYAQPPPIDPNEPLNAFNVMFNRPDQDEWKDFTLYVDGVTGEEVKWSEYRNRLEVATTALGAPVSQGGLGLGVEGVSDVRDDGTVITPVKEMIGIMSENSVDYSVLVNSLLAATTPYALISTHSTRFELLHALKLTRLTRLFVQAKHLPLVLSAAEEVGIPKEKIYVMGSPEASVNGHQTLSGLMENVRRRRTPPVGVRLARVNSLAYLIFSSGTSGLPKAVMITHGSLSASLLQAGTIGVSNTNPPPVIPNREGNPVGLAFLPMHHVYGLGAYAQRAFWRPIKLIMMPRWNVDDALRLIKQYEITHLALVPAAVHQLAHHPQVSKDHFKSIMNAGCGAAYTPLELVNKFQQYLPVEMEFLVGYGMSEGTFNATVQPSLGTISSTTGTGSPILKTPGEGSIGVLNPGMEGRVLREDGSDADVGEPGELFLRGGNIVPGYWENPGANRETFVRFEGDGDGGKEKGKGRWLNTGDRVWVTEGGAVLHPKSLRLPSIPRRNRERPLGPPDRLITDASVAGVTPVDNGNRKDLEEKVPRAWVVLSEEGKRRGEESVIAELDRWAKESLSRYKWLRGGIEIVQEIPKNPTGKTMRRVLVDAYEKKLKTKSKL